MQIIKSQYNEKNVLKPEDIQKSIYKPVFGNGGDTCSVVFND